MSFTAPVLRAYCRQPLYLSQAGLSSEFLSPKQMCTWGVWKEHYWNFFKIGWRVMSPENIPPFPFENASIDVSYWKICFSLLFKLSPQKTFLLKISAVEMDPFLSAQVYPCHWPEPWVSLTLCFVRKLCTFTWTQISRESSLPFHENFLNSDRKSQENVSFQFSYYCYYY